VQKFLPGDSVAGYFWWCGGTAKMQGLAARPEKLGEEEM
jgi:hypothetical protein